MKILKLSYLLIAFAIIMTSCSSDKPEEIKHIPKDASFVFTINAHDLMIKSGVKNFSETKLYKNISQIDSTDMDKEGYDKMMEFSYIFENPKESGVDFAKQFFVFRTSNSKGWRQSMVMNFGISDATKFESLITKATKDNMDSMKFEKNANLNYLISTKVDNSTILVWNSETAIIYHAIKGNKGAKYLIKHASGLLNQQLDESIASNKSFMDFYDNRKDVSVWFTSDFMINRLPDQYKTIVAMQLPISTNGIEYRYYLNFEKGYAQAESQLILPDELKSLIDNFKIIKDNFDDQMLQYIPQKSFANLSIAIDAHELYRMIKYLYNERQINVDGMESMAEAAMGVDFEKIFTSINGEMIFNVHSISIEKQNDTIEKDCGNSIDVKASVLIKLENEEVYKSTLKLFDENKKQMVDGYYEILDEGSELYITMVDNIMMLTNDRSVIIGFVNHEAQNPSLKDSQIAKYLNNYALFGMVNMDLSKYDSGVQDYYNKQYSRLDKASLRNKLSEIRYEPSDSYNTKLVLEFKDKQRNSLEVLFN